MRFKSAVKVRGSDM